MAIKPIDYHLTYNNTIHEAKEKQNDFNRVKDTNAFLQNHQKTEIERNRNKIQDTEQTEGKKINNEKKQHSKKQHSKKQKKEKNRNKSSNTKNKSKAELKRGQKLDIFI